MKGPGAFESVRVNSIIRPVANKMPVVIRKIKIFEQLHKQFKFTVTLGLEV